MAVQEDVESDVACKAGNPGNVNDDLSSLRYKDVNKKEIDPELLILNDAQMIDKGLAIYYKKMKRNDYYTNNKKTIGLFLKYFQDHEYDIDDIIDQLTQLPDNNNNDHKNDENTIKNCQYLEFPMFKDDNFPMDKQYKNENDKRQEQFNILKHCWQFGVPPLKPQLMPKRILLIHGYYNGYLLSPNIEQTIFLFLAIDTLHWRIEIGYKQRIRNILDHYSNWDLMDKISCIIPNFLWLGDEDCAIDINTLQSLGINYILNCAGYDVMDVKYPSNFQTHVLFADDADDYNIINDDIASCIEFVTNCINNNGKILIHCLAGMNRSATITIAVLMYFKGMDLLSCIKYTQQRRGWILSNESFQRQLVQYAQKLDLLIGEN